MSRSKLIKRWRAAPYSYAASCKLVEELGVSETLAAVLARRGLATPAEARAFLQAGEQHDPSRLAGMTAAVRTVRAAVESGKTVTVHGDYDVDGVSSVAIVVGFLRELGAAANWFVPSRFEDGYGLSKATVERLAAQGTELLLTVDCGVTSIDEIARAAELGIEVVVCDHHSPGERLPGCVVVHPQLGDYPFPELCAAGVAYKLVQSLCRSSGRDPAEADSALDLVALATIADVVPLRGENRALVRRGLSLLAASRRPGIRALAEVAKVELASIKAHDVAFRLAPRINAAGRLYRADAGVELLLTDDIDRAGEIALELDAINRERQEVTQAVLFEAEAQCSRLLKSDAGQAALVLSGEGWHPGVIGIVASKIVQSYDRPCIVIALSGEFRSGARMPEGIGRGSGRSIPAYDLLEGLVACSDRLLRFGGHRMAAGLEIAPDGVEAFRKALVKHAAGQLAGEDLVAVERIDAVVSGEALGLGLAEELEQLAPFGAGNPTVNLLLPAARIGDVTAMGDGKHARFSVASNGVRARAVAFGCGGKLPIDLSDSLDLCFGLEANHWNGTVEPRLILRSLWAPLSQDGRSVSYEDYVEPVDDPDFWSAVAEELVADLGEAPPALTPQRRRLLVDARGRGILGYLAKLLSTGENVVAVCADVSRRRALVGDILSPTRFGADYAAVFSKLSSVDRLERLSADVPSKKAVAFADYETVASSKGLLRSFDHVVLLDPPGFRHWLDAAVGSGTVGRDTGHAHLVWGPAEVEFAKAVLQQEYGLRAPLREVYRGLSRLQEGASADNALVEARSVVAGKGIHQRSPAVVGRLLRVLCELGLLVVERGSKSIKTLAIVRSNSKVELEQSETFRAYSRRCQEGLKFLQRAQTSKFP